MLTTLLFFCSSLGSIIASSSSTSSLNSNSSSSLTDSQKLERGKKEIDNNVDEIFRVFYSILKNESIDSEKASKEFSNKDEYSKFLKETYNKVMNKLARFQKGKKRPNLHDDNLLERLESIVKNNEKELANHSFFWSNLERFLFKYILHLKSKMIKATDDQLEKVSKNIRFIISMVQKNHHSNISLNFSLKLMNAKDFDPSFLSFEFLENFDHLNDSFVGVLRYFSHFLLDNQKELESRKWFDCKKLNMKLFKNGNLNIDILLNFFIVENDHEGLIKPCLESNSEQYPLEITKELIRKTATFIQMLEKYNKSFLKEKIIRLYISNNPLAEQFLTEKTILIKNEVDLYKSLQEMRDSGLLQRKTIEKTLVFQTRYNNQKWNLESFGSYLEKYAKRPSITANESDLLDECLDIFNPIGDLYNNVIDKLTDSKYLKFELFFDLENFAFNLYQSLLNNKNPIPSNDPFWSNLQRILFKWLISRKKIDNEWEFKNALNNVRKFIPILKEKNINFNFSFETDPLLIKDRSDMSTFKELMDCELIENRETFELLASILEDYYKPKEGKEKENDIERESICNKLKKESFNNDFNNDQLLKFAITLYDPKGDLRRECFPREIDSITRLLGTNEEIQEKWTESSLNDYIAKLRNFEKFTDLIISDMDHVGGSIIEVFLKSDHRFLIKDYNDLSILLRQLRGRKDLDERLLADVIKFKCQDEKNGKEDKEEFTWGGEFRKLLKMAKDNALVDKGDFEFYMQLVTDPESLVSKESK